MARIFALAFALALVLVGLVALVDAAPLTARQLGNLQCNAARLKIVGALRASGKNIASIDTSDPAASAAASTAGAGIDDANAGVKTIAGAILTGQQPPAAARDQVAQGLLSAQSALEGMNSTDPAVASSLASVNKAIDAGEAVVANCK